MKRRMRTKPYPPYLWVVEQSSFGPPTRWEVVMHPNPDGCPVCFLTRGRGEALVAPLHIRLVAQLF